MKRLSAILVLATTFCVGCAEQYPRSGPGKSAEQPTQPGRFQLYEGANGPYKSTLLLDTQTGRVWVVGGDFKAKNGFAEFDPIPVAWNDYRSAIANQTTSPTANPPSTGATADKQPNR